MNNNNSLQTSQLHNSLKELCEHDLVLKRAITDLVNIDFETVNSAKIICFKKRDCPMTDGLHGIMLGHMDIMRSNQKFDIQVTSINFEEYKNGKGIYEHKVFALPGSSFTNYFFNNPKRCVIGYADIIKIQATTSTLFGKKYTYSYLFVRNS